LAWRIPPVTASYRIAVRYLVPSHATNRFRRTIVILAGDTFASNSENRAYEVPAAMVTGKDVTPAPAGSNESFGSSATLPVVVTAGISPRAVAVKVPV